MADLELLRQELIQKQKNQEDLHQELEQYSQQYALHFGYNLEEKDMEAVIKSVEELSSPDELVNATRKFDQLFIYTNVIYLFNAIDDLMNREGPCDMEVIGVYNHVMMINQYLRENVMGESK